MVLVDVEKVIAGKNPKLLKRLPRFMINYLKRIIHQDDLNDTFSQLEGVNSFDFCHAVLKKLNIPVEVHGIENIPKTGKAILAANHPLGGMDALALVTAIEPVRKDIKFLVNDILLYLENMAGLFVGVNKHGKNSAQSLNEVKTLFEKDHLVTVFPAGLVSRRRKGVITDLVWKKTFITRARKNGSQIIPVFISGRMSNFFYNLANFRTRLGIKTNLEMLYLVNEQYKLADQTIKIVFGKPIKASQIDRSKTDKAWASWMKEQVYLLKH